jgi:tripartite-type tricarboxylate transporter receptor subunit TctC
MFTRRAVIGGLATLGHPWIGLARTVEPQIGGIETLIVPFAAGGPADVAARKLAPVMSERLQRKVIVENRAGAGGVTGLAAVATSRADGRTIGFATVGPLAMAPHMLPNVPFDPTRDIAHIGLIAKVSELVVVSSAMPVRSFGEFLDYARLNPGKVTVGSTGTGGIAHLAIELLKSKAGVDVVHVPYRGAAPALVDVMAGQVNAMIADISIFIGQANSDKLRPLALAGDKRSPLMPDVPTTTEAGLPGYKVENWYGFIAPKDTPPEEQNFLNTALNVAVNDPDVIRSFNDLGAVTIGGTPAEFRDFALQEYARWGGIIRDAGIKIN